MNILLAGLMIPALITFCASTKEDRPSSGTWIYYSVGGDMGIYKDGAFYGHKLEISMDGQFRIYRRYVHRQNEESSLRDSLHLQGELDPGRIDTLVELIHRADFFELPERLPNVSPLEAGFREPAESVEMTVRRKDGSAHRITAHMGADIRHYPGEFIELHRYLRRLVRTITNPSEC